MPIMIAERRTSKVSSFSLDTIYIAKSANVI